MNRPRPSELLSLVDTADALGVSTRTVRRYIAQGRLRAYRVGPHLIRVRVADLEPLLRPVQSAWR